MTYKETLEFLFSQLPAYYRIGKAAYKNDLTNSIALDNYLGNPHLKYRTVHIAGTNGKGSVSHMVASVFQEAGYVTGLYTSPHIKDFRERIKINGKMISENDVVAFVANNKDILESLQPSFFEMTVAMAFDHFAKGNVDVAVIEVGLGGRLDSTNIITPVLSVITNIGHDHMDLLGDTLVKIAIEKAGIIKNNIPVVISETQEEIKDVFIERADEKRSAITFADQQFSCELDGNPGINSERKYTVTELSTNRQFTGKTVLVADYQAGNLTAVFSVFSQLKEIFSVSSGNITRGIRKVILNTDLKGRWQILNRNPLTICDTGHNKEGLEYAIGQIARIPKSGLHIIIGFVNDKDINSVLPLFPVDAVYYFTKASIPRAMNEDILMKEAEKHGLRGNPYSDVRSALLSARQNAGPSDMIFIGGSIFVVAEVL